jgi:hypothetical protein
MEGVRLYLAGDGPLPKAEKAVEATCAPILDAIWHPTRSRDLVNCLLPAVHAALGPEADMLNLEQAVRTELFARRFRDAVLNLAGPTRAVA